jgi:hypothetical protein
MRRFIMLVTVVLLMTAMLVASAAPALAALVEPKCCALFDAPGWELVLDVTS